MKKSKTRLYINEILSLDMIVCIKEKQYHFLKNVLRSKINDIILVFDNQTGEWYSKIISVKRGIITLEVFKKRRDLNLEIESDIWIAFAPIKNQRLGIIIQKVTELGVAKLIPCITNYTDNTFLNYNSLNLNIIEASEQCNRLTLPILEKEIKIDQFIDNHPSDRALVFCDENLISKKNMFNSIVPIKNQYQKWTLLIGPEGGFSKEESDKIISLSNTISVSLGKRVLRSDTALTVALYCLQSIIENNT